nr:hypothetical protein Itr_chr03CG05820 [Ipomoea trifida]
MWKTVTGVLPSYNADMLDLPVTTRCSAKGKPQFNGEASSAKPAPQQQPADNGIEGHIEKRTHALFLADVWRRRNGISRKPPTQLSEHSVVRIVMWLCCWTLSATTVPESFNKETRSQMAPYDGLEQPIHYSCYVDPQRAVSGMNTGVTVITLPVVV